MSEAHNSNTSWWTNPATATTTPPAPPPPPVTEHVAAEDAAPGPGSADKTAHDTLRRRGFFEAIKDTECPQHQMAVLLKEYEQQARDQIAAAENIAAKKTEHLMRRIAVAQQRIAALNLQVEEAKQYKEEDDSILQALLQQQEKEEGRLSVLQQRVAEARIKLAEAKAGIVQKSLEEAESQVRMALHIQKMIYDETRALNLKKFNDEKDQLTRLAKCFQELYDYYYERYKRINTHLRVLDADGVSPLTSQVLTSIGTISFGAAGFFFSTFAGNTGFGNQDAVFFVLGGVIDAAQEKGYHGFLKVAILFGLIILVTLVSKFANDLLNRLKRKTYDEEILSEVMMSMRLSKKMQQLQYSVSAKSNNWYAFWLQLIPAVLIAGLLMLAVARTATSEKVNALSASTEGLIIGACIAISVAGLLYLYIIKIVEPRLVRHYDVNAGNSVNWVRANWELVSVLLAFIVFAVAVILIPYKKGSNGLLSLPQDQQTRYAVLLFICICLVGGMSFAYSVRNRGLIQTHNFLGRVISKLNGLIAQCSSAETPELHNTVAEEHGNIIHHVLKQLTFKATLNQQVVEEKKARKAKNFFDRLEALLTQRNQEDKPPPEPVVLVTQISPEEARYFPQAEGELAVVKFEYTEQQQKTVAAVNAVRRYREERQEEQDRCADAIDDCHDVIDKCEIEIEQVLKEKYAYTQEIRSTYDRDIADLLDGFHLGMWYRENGMGPVHQYFQPCSPPAITYADGVSAQ